MKIILEIPDSASSPKEAATEATVSAAQPKAESPAPPKQPQPPTPRATKEAAEPKKEEKPTPPAASSGNFAHQGGISVISDPDRDKPGVFRFSYTEEK